MSVDTLITKIQVHLNDDAGQTFTKEYILPRITIVNEDLQNDFEDLDLSYDEAVIVIPNVPLGTTDLSMYQAPGGVLQDMVSPILIEWRLVGQDDTQWKDVPKVDKVLDRVNEASVDSYEWRAGLVYLSPATVAVDLRVRCTVLPNVLRGDSDTFIKGLEGCIAWLAAALIYADNGNDEFAEKKREGGMKALDNIEGIMVKEEQNVPRRWGGRRSRAAMLPWGGPFSLSGSQLTGSTGGGGGGTTATLTRYPLVPVPDGVNNTFTATIPLTANAFVLRNGVIEDPSSYNASGTIVQFTPGNIPTAGDTLWVLQ